MMDFTNWLMEKKGFSRKASNDSLSRLKRVKGILCSEKITDSTLKDLENAAGFKSLSVSVKSQLRRAIRLYLEFVNM